MSKETTELMERAAFLLLHLWETRPPHDFRLKDQPAGTNPVHSTEGVPALLWNNSEQSAALTTWRRSGDEVTTGCNSSSKTKHPTHKHSKTFAFREWRIGGCRCVSVCECVSRLPEVGDLFLSMSIDCWLSVSSVRPAAADRKKKQHTQCVRLFEAGHAD